MPKPSAYRETPFVLPDGSITYVSALARPDSSRQDTRAVFSYLKTQGVQVIFGLDVSHSFLAIASTMELNYVDANIEDFTAPELELYDRVYDEVIRQASLGKKVAIHCYGGNGRTGCVLAALKLREMSLSESFYDNVANQSEKVYCYPSKDCTPNVSMAVETLRRQPGNSHIVEAGIQIKSLCDYEKVLIARKLAEESKDEQAIPSMFRNF